MYWFFLAILLIVAVCGAALAFYGFTHSPAYMRNAAAEFCGLMIFASTIFVLIEVSDHHDKTEYSNGTVTSITVRDESGFRVDVTNRRGGDYSELQCASQDYCKQLSLGSQVQMKSHWNELGFGDRPVIVGPAK